MAEVRRCCPGGCNNERRHIRIRPGFCPSYRLQEEPTDRLAKGRTRGQDRRVFRRAVDRSHSALGYSPMGDPSPRQTLNCWPLDLELLAILATNSASGFLRAGHANAIGQGREVQLRSAYRHGQGRTRDRREAWSAGGGRTGRRGVSAIEDDRIGAPGGTGCSRSADVGRWNGQRGGEKSIGRHAKRSWQRCHQPAAAPCVAQRRGPLSRPGVRFLPRASDRECRTTRYG